MAQEPDGASQAGLLARMDRFAMGAGRALIFLVALLFLALWIWYFVTALRAEQYPWAFSSLLLFALFLRALTIAPRGQASRVEFGLASAKILIEYEAPKQAEAVVEKIKEAIPVEARKAFEEAKPRLLEETVHAFYTLSEQAARQALASSSTAAVSPGSAAGYTWPTSTPLAGGGFDDFWKREMMRRAILRRMDKPTDPSSGSAR